MPRTAREKSKSGVYHIMLRGANRQEIFHDDEDCVRFLEILERYKKRSEAEVYGWCLMVNHLHLLLREGTEELSVTMKRIGVSYAGYYNLKYRTIGHLFQDRYKSENIENDNYLLAAIRYIHQNPIKAGLAKRPDEWEWSSNNAYCTDSCYPHCLLDSGLIMGIFSEDRGRFKEYNESANEDRFIDDTLNMRLMDEQAGSLIKSAIGEYEIPQIKSLPKLQRDKVLAGIKEISGIKQRQISRILGIPLSVINRA